MQVKHLPAYEYQRMRWRNGLGWTREIARAPEGDDPPHWRASIAEIDHDCAYSTYPGLRREQVLIEGNGYRLRFEDGREASAQPPHGRIAFAGEDTPQCQLDDGPVRVFNLFHDPRQVSARIHHRPLVGTLVIFAEPRSTWLIYLIAGRMQLRGDGHTLLLGQGDSLRLDNPLDSRQRQLIDGGGAILLVSFAPP